MRYALLMVLAAVVAAVPAMAEVVNRGESGFTVRTVVTIAQPPDRVYDALAHVADWWDPAHTWSGDSANLRIDAKAGGCFCETLPNGGSVEHATVMFIAPGKELRLRGALGPLQSMGVTGSLVFDLVEVSGGTQATVTYVVGGYVPGGAGVLAVPVDGVIGGQLRRLKAFVERTGP